MVIILTAMVLLGKLAMMIQGFTNMDTTTAPFSSTNMEPEYKDGGSVQYFVKLVRNTGYNYAQNLDRIAEKGTSAWIDIVATGEITFAAAYDFDQKYFMFCSETPANEVQMIVPMTTTYQQFFTNFGIKAVAGGGFRVQNVDPLNPHSILFGWTRVIPYTGVAVP